VIAIKEVAVDLAPWADMAYGCDAPWWIHRRGLPDFKGLKVAWDDKLSSQFPDIHLIKIGTPIGGRPRFIDKILVDEPGVVGAGRSSGFQAINLAVQFGARRILLLGFDLSGTHYYGRNNWLKAGNPDEAQFDRCRQAYEDNAPLLKALGVDVMNGSPSKIAGFRQGSIDQALREWVEPNMVETE